jgi:hypothetical protein
MSSVDSGGEEGYIQGRSLMPPVTVRIMCTQTGSI